MLLRVFVLEITNADMGMVLLRLMVVLHIVVGGVGIKEEIKGIDSTVTSSNQRFIISGYWPEFRTDYDINATALYLTDLMLHSIEPTPDGNITNCCLDEINYDLAQLAKAYKKEMTGEDLRIWIAVGGWGRSNGFESILEDAATKKKFLMNLKATCFKHNIGGVDFDWQQPVSDEDTFRFYHLLKSAKATLGKVGIKIGVALDRGRQLPTKVYQHVDRVHLLNYEMDLSTMSVYHADFDKVRDMVKSFIVGCPPHKMTLGIPLYARVRQQPGEMRTIAEMVTEQANGDINAILEAESEYNNFEFDTLSKIDVKVRLSLELGLGGVHFWELGQDYIDSQYGPGGIMLKAVLDAEQRYRAETGDKHSSVAKGDEL